MIDRSFSGNQLAGATSPYLLQHASNPVHWRHWGKAAFAEAAARDCPILLSVGYAACHWCHVMAHESFENPAIADLMNRLFVNVKVDREERPDVDAIHMAALHAMGEQGGWPLTMFLDQDGKPFWGGTYFPPAPRHGRPGFPDILRAIADAWRQRRTAVAHNADSLFSHLREMSAPPAASGSIPVAGVADLSRALLSVMDPVNGGIGGQPKFPNAPLLEIWMRDGLANPAAAAALDLTLKRISLGGVYDHLAGGIARYSVDDKWLVPHFEKMLYDNAHYLRALCHADLANPSALFRNRIALTISWLRSEMLLPEGGFASSLDADSEGREGKFYVWTRQEIAAALGQEAGSFSAAYDVTAHGNFEHANILNRLSAPDADEDRFADDRVTLLALRNRRIRPALDDKVLADWNGYAIRALAECAFIHDRHDWLALATGAYRFVAESMSNRGRLAHSWRKGRCSPFGFSSDHASMMNAAIALYMATQDPAYLADARQWGEVLAGDFSDGNGGLALSPPGADLAIRPRGDLDEANPSSSSQALEAYARYAAIAGDSAYLDRAHALANNIAAANAAANHGLAGYRNACDTLLNGRHVTIRAESPMAIRQFIDVMRKQRDPALTFAIAATDSIASSMGWTIPTLSRTCAVVCSRQQCSAPLASPAELAEFLNDRR